MARSLMPPVPRDLSPMRQRIWHFCFLLYELSAAEQAERLRGALATMDMADRAFAVYATAGLPNAQRRAAREEWVRAVEAGVRAYKDLGLDNDDAAAAAP